ncbi:hypothetical protein DYI37_11045 [Fulvimarina endophytica]|uniref:Uncharacterized protein n=1 Tax=Fulvimarina endophytica TaxID=2293836 RepID=A0A371X2T4_9HYPH|nr:hypothetical protein [Fulvimarina endophytica]RFC63545.1 hypothetical protein DYI37_11045 [Fulvimarina endophytica]
MADEEQQPTPFEPTASYTKPSLPTDEFLKRALSKIRALFSRDSDEPYIANEKLTRADHAILDKVAPRPAYGPLVEELQATLQPWIEERQPRSHIMTIVLPPCEADGLLEEWAERHGHEILSAPERPSLISLVHEPVLKDLSGDGVLVIPRLEHWFLRHHDGLGTLRRLLAAIDLVDRRVVVGCNSWAWEFVSKAVGANLILPAPQTFRPFDEKRLHAWISHLTATQERREFSFKLSQSGKDVMTVDEDGNLVSDFFKSLAGRSLGIPWVAWHLWRRCLRAGGETGEEASVDERGADDAHTLWVAMLEDFLLPGSGDPAVLLSLHALLLHGGLTISELRLVLPTVGESNVLSALMTAGLVYRDGSLLKCEPAAYPSIREGLSSAGFSMDSL